MNLDNIPPNHQHAGALTVIGLLERTPPQQFTGRITHTVLSEIFKMTGIFNKEY